MCCQWSSWPERTRRGVESCLRSWTTHTWQRRTISRHPLRMQSCCCLTVTVTRLVSAMWWTTTQDLRPALPSSTGWASCVAAAWMWRTRACKDHVSQVEKEESFPEWGRWWLCACEHPEWMGFLDNVRFLCWSWTRHWLEGVCWKMWLVVWANVHLMWQMGLCQVWCQLGARWCQFDPFDPSRVESNGHFIW